MNENDQKWYHKWFLNFTQFYLSLRMKMIKSDIINDSRILHNFTDLRSQMLFVWQ